MKNYHGLLLLLVFCTLWSACKDHSVSTPTSSCDVYTQLSTIKPGSYWIYTHINTASDSAIFKDTPKTDSLVVVGYSAQHAKDGVTALKVLDFIWTAGKVLHADTLYWVFSDNKFWSSAHSGRPSCTCDASALDWRLLYDCNAEARTLARKSMSVDSVSSQVFDSTSHTMKTIRQAAFLSLENAFTNSGQLYIATPNATHVNAELLGSNLSWTLTIVPGQSGGQYKEHAGFDSREMRFTAIDGILQYERRTILIDGINFIGTTEAGDTFPLSFERRLLRYSLVH